MTEQRRRRLNNNVFDNNVFDNNVIVVVEAKIVGVPMQMFATSRITTVANDVIIVVC